MKRKFSLLLIFLLILSLGLAACKSANSQATSSQPANEAGSAQGNDQANAPLAEIDKLAIGTLKLDGTDQAVTPEQAAELLTLWQAYQAISDSDTTAKAELEAVVNQIQENMTSEQIQAIDAMGITRQTMFEEMQTLGIDFGSRGGANQGTLQADGTQTEGGFPGRAGDGDMPGGGMPGGGMPGGGMPGGGMPGGGGSGGFGGQITPDATMQARFANQANRVNPMLLQALIEMLESK
jgi:hypothetical protein